MLHMSEDVSVRDTLQKAHTQLEACEYSYKHCLDLINRHVRDVQALDNPTDEDLKTCAETIEKQSIQLNLLVDTLLNLRLFISTHENNDVS